MDSAGHGAGSTRTWCRRGQIWVSLCEQFSCSHSCLAASRRQSWPSEPGFGPTESPAAALTFRTDSKCPCRFCHHGVRPVESPPPYARQRFCRNRSDLISCLWSIPNTRMHRRGSVYGLVPFTGCRAGNPQWALKPEGSETLCRPPPWSPD